MLTIKPQLMSEFIGTFFLVFFGTFSIIIFGKMEFGSIPISLTFGMIVMVLIYSLSHISGAHFNPAVSIAFLFKKMIDKKTCALYIVSQSLGAVLASLTLSAIFTDSSTLGETLPSGGVVNAIVIETVFTFFLMFVILNCSKHNEIKSFTAIAVGATIFIEALVGGSISGASMNPVRSLGPALINNNLDSLYLYLIFPVLGALLAVIIDNQLKNRQV